MGVLDSLRDLLGFGAEADATRPADADDFFQLPGASVTMEADLDFAPMHVAALCFGNVDSTQFEHALRDVEDVLEFGGWRELTTDDHGYRWAVVERDSFEDLVTELYVAADTMDEEGFGSRLLAAVFPFERDGERVYWIYSFRRGSFYPFAPRDGHERNTSLELKLQSVLEADLDVEGETEYWYPLWADTPGGHPWE